MDSTGIIDDIEPPSEGDGGRVPRRSAGPVVPPGRIDGRVAEPFERELVSNASGVLEPDRPVSYLVAQLVVGAVGSPDQHVSLGEHGFGEPVFGFVERRR